MPKEASSPQPICLEVNTGPDQHRDRSLICSSLERFIILISFYGGQISLDRASSQVDNLVAKKTTNLQPKFEILKRLYKLDLPGKLDHISRFPSRLRIQALTMKVGLYQFVSCQRTSPLSVRAVRPLHVLEVSLIPKVCQFEETRPGQQYIC
jgi:hypothetical protein